MELSKAVECLNRLPLLIEGGFDVIRRVGEEILHNREKLRQAVEKLNTLPFEPSGGYDALLKSHPVLGDLTDNNVFNERPLFESIQVGMKEPQYTTALGYFLRQDKAAFRVFTEALSELIEMPESFKLPERDDYTESFWEEPCPKKEDENAAEDEDSEKKSKGGSKEVDNLLIWENNGKRYGFVIEIKFNAKLKNDLECYRKRAKARIGNAPVCVILSPYVISDKDVKGNKNWHRLLWRDLMPKLNEKMRKTKTDSDFKRFLSSLWRKTLGI